ncbi:SAVED domain-containing protein [Desulfoscipio sp. XC116]|uniref:SAVED domain-containing protein n=1 Tax=Desulfoscipio sp. XC116 TaxID=3144975 RepID=UPI00325C2668
MIAENNYDYELAISYAREDEKVVERFASEFQNIFADRVFLDKSKIYEFAGVKDFEGALASIYGMKARSVVIFYSKKYEEKHFTVIEFNAVIERLQKDKKLLCFIVSIGDVPVNEAIKKNHYFSYFIKNLDRDEQCKKIVAAIKETMMHNNLLQAKQIDQDIDLKIQSITSPNNRPSWEKNYNWCILLGEFMETDGRRLKAPYAWPDVLASLGKDFANFKKHIYKLGLDEIKINIILNCHLSLAYALGRWYGDIIEKRGNPNLVLQGTKNGTKFDFSRIVLPDTPLPMPEIKVLDGNKGSNDTVVILKICSGNEDMDFQVKYYCDNVIHLDYDQILYFKYNARIAEKAAGKHLKEIAEFIIQQISDKGSKLPGRKIHLFAGTMAALMFVLGGRSRYLGPVQLYEYNFNTQEYTPSLCTDNIFCWERESHA